MSTPRVHDRRCCRRFLDRIPICPRVRNPVACRFSPTSPPRQAVYWCDPRRPTQPSSSMDASRAVHRRPFVVWRLVRIVSDLSATASSAEDRRIVITTAQPAQSVSVDLQPSRVATASAARTPASAGPAVDETLVGALDVESRPPGARVFLDGTLVGTTPFASTRIGAGRHAIRTRAHRLPPLAVVGVDRGRRTQQGHGVARTVKQPLRIGGHGRGPRPMNPGTRSSKEADTGSPNAPRRNSRRRVCLGGPGELGD